MKDLFEVHEQLIGKDQQAKIRESKVAIIGIGGLGCTVAQGLIRLGIGQLSLCDLDKVELSNLPRQSLFGLEDIGKYKVDSAKEKLLTFPSKPNVKAYKDNFTTKTGKEILQNTDIVVDCTDNISSRYAISKVTEQLGLPMVYGGVDKFQGQVAVFNYKGSKPFHKAFPKLEELLETESCKSSGVLPFVVQILGQYQVAEVFKIITMHKDVLNNRLLSINLLSGKSRILKLK